VKPEALIDAPVSKTPPGGYPPPDTSFTEEYTVVDSFKSALAVYNAMYKVFVAKLWTPVYSSFLKLVVWVWRMLLMLRAP
jgi:hypothetical protein